MSKHNIVNPMNGNFYLEEFAWKCVWLELGRLSQYVGPHYTRLKARKLIRQARRRESQLTFRGRRTEWTAMVENWYRQEQEQQERIALSTEKLEERTAQ